MTAGVDLERRLSAWFEDAAPAHAPDRVLAASLERVAVLPQRRPMGRRVGWAWAGLSRRQRLAIALAATVALLVGGLAIGAWLVQQLPRPPALVIVRSDGAFPEPVGITVLAQEPDGTTRTLASWTAAALGGSFSENAGVAMSTDGHLAVPVSTAAGTSEYRIVDLRDPSAPPRTPDAESMFGAWGPSDRFAMIVNAGGYVAYDAHTGVSTAVSATNVGPREVVFRPVWSADGRGVHANGSFVGPQGGAGTLMLDGTFEVGMHAEFPTGVGPRRTAPDGARIQCLEGEDYGCEDGATISRFSDVDASKLFVDDRAEVRIADFAVSADGRSLWVLLETVASGPRTLTLVRRAADGTERVVTTFDAVADDPDEGSYFEGGSLAGLAPDDTRIVVRLAGDGGSTGARWAIDPASGERVSVDGAPAGWLTRDTLTAPRPAIEAIVETDLALRGSWVTMRPERVGAIPEGYHELTLRRSMGSLDVGFGQRIGLSVSGDGPDGLIVRQERAAIGCAAGSIARYRWSIADAHLRLEASDDDCVARRLLLEQTFEAVLPSGDTNSVPVEAGSTVIASRFAVPFRLTVPAGGLLAQSHSADTVAVSDDPEGRFLTIVPVVAGAADPCDRFTAGAPLEPGLAAAVAYLEGLGDLGATVERQPEMAIGDRPGPTFRLTGPASCEGRFAVFARNGRALTVPDGASVTLVEPRPGTVVAIIVGPDPGGDPAWVSALLGSIDFVDEVPTS